MQMDVGEGERVLRDRLYGGGCRVESIKGQALGRWVQGREYQGAGSGEVA